MIEKIGVISRKSFDVIAGIVLVALSVVPALMFTSFAVKFWPLFSAIFAVGGTLILLGFFRMKIHDSTILNAEGGRIMRDRNRCDGILKESVHHIDQYSWDIRGEIKHTGFRKCKSSQI